MSIPSPNVAVYTEGPLVTPDSLNTLKAWVDSLPHGNQRDRLNEALADAPQAADVAVSGFSTVLIGLFHLDNDGTIHYNGFPFESNAAAFNEAFAALKNTPGSTVETVIVSFAVTNSTNMKSKWETFKPQLLELMQNAGAQGVDWDYKPDADFDAPFIAQMTNDVADEGYLVTAAPFSDSSVSDWVTVIEATVNKSGTGNNFACWALQIEGPGSVAPYVSWLYSLQKATTGMTPDQLETFFSPAFQPGDCSNFPTQQIEALRQKAPYLNGAFIYRYQAIALCAKQMAAGIRSALPPVQ